MFKKIKLVIIQAVIRRYDKRWENYLARMLESELKHLPKESRYWKSKMDKCQENTRKLQMLL